MTARRILIISGEYPPMQGGVGDFVSVLGRHLAERGRHVHILTSRHGRQAPEPRDDRLDVHPVMESWRWRPLIAAVRGLLHTARPQVINIQYQTAAYGMHPAINFLPYLFPKIPVVATFHDLRVPYLFPKAGPLRGWVVRALARGSRAAIVTNKEDKNRLLADGGVRHLELVPIGSSIDRSLPIGYDRAAWRRKWGVPQNALLLCHFGFINASKGIEDLVASLPMLVRRGLDPWLLMIGGTVGASDPSNRDQLARVQTALGELGAKERVVWTGHLSVEEVSACFDIADICVLPYRDGASFRRTSLMAALFHGMPIVTTIPRVQVDELVHGDNIWLVPIREPQALADAIALLATNRGLGRRVGLGAQSLSRMFDWGRTVESTIKVYDRVAAK